MAQGDDAMEPGYPLIANVGRKDEELQKRGQRVSNAL